MEMVTIEIGKFAKKQEERLLHHVNIEAIQLLDNSELVQKLTNQKLYRDNFQMGHPRCVYQNNIVFI
jgi:hypothetical protein